MVKYLLTTTNTYRVHTVADDPRFELTQFSYTTKDVKEKREVVDQYQVVKAKLVFTSEKEPEVQYEVEYNEI